MTHVWAEKCVTPGKIALNFPLGTQFLKTCVTQGMSRNLTDTFSLSDTTFQRQKCVTQGMSTVIGFTLEWHVFTTYHHIFLAGASRREIDGASFTVRC